MKVQIVVSIGSLFIQLHCMRFHLEQTQTLLMDSSFAKVPSGGCEIYIESFGEMIWVYVHRNVTLWSHELLSMDSLVEFD